MSWSLSDGVHEGERKQVVREFRVVASGSLSRTRRKVEEVERDHSLEVLPEDGVDLAEGGRSLLD